MSFTPVYMLSVIGRCYCNAAVVGLLALVQPTTSVFSDKLRRVLFTYSGVSTMIRLVAGI